MIDLGFQDLQEDFDKGFLSDLCFQGSFNYFLNEEKKFISDCNEVSVGVQSKQTFILTN